VAGWLFMVAAAIVLAVGLFRYRGFKADILSIQKNART